MRSEKSVCSLVSSLYSRNLFFSIDNEFFDYTREEERRGGQEQESVKTQLNI